MSLPLIVAVLVGWVQREQQYTTEREPHNVVGAVKAAGIALLRIGSGRPAGRGWSPRLRKRVRLAKRKGCDG